MVNRVRYEDLFCDELVLTIEQLKQLTGRPRESILRDLKGVGYYSSYNEKGKFYTLADTPEFDANGLWKYKDAYFSVNRTLLDTAEHLVNVSNAGFMHSELRQLLGIGIQNSLYQLFVSDRLARLQINGQYVYFGKESIDSQVEKRNILSAGSASCTDDEDFAIRGHPEIDFVLIIDILIAVLRGNKTESAVYNNLCRAGSPVTEQQVMTVFLHYNIGKKNTIIQK